MSCMTLEDVKYYVDKFETIYEEFKPNESYYDRWDLALFKISINDVWISFSQQMTFAGLEPDAKEEYQDFKANYSLMLSAIDEKLGGRFNRLSTKTLLDFCLQSKERSI